MCKYLLDLIGLTLRRQLQLEDYYNSNYNNKTKLSIISLNLHHNAFETLLFEGEQTLLLEFITRVSHP